MPICLHLTTTCAAYWLLLLCQLLLQAALLPWVIGMTVMLCHFALVPVDGCSINPARSFGSAIVTNTWESHWVSKENLSENCAKIAIHCRLTVSSTDSRPTECVLLLLLLLLPLQCISATATTQLMQMFAAPVSASCVTVSASRCACTHYDS
jgi:hypothetical protein